MKSNLNLTMELMVIFLCFQTFSCKKEPGLPVITTQDVIEIDYRTATSGGNVISDGGSSVVSRGLCWNTSGEPTINDSISLGGSGSGPFRKSITNLIPGTVYYLRAYATNNAGTCYGSTVSFETIKIGLPVLYTLPVSFISQTAIKTGGGVAYNNGGTIITQGICWGTEPNSTIDLPTKTTEIINGVSFLSEIRGLTAGNTYYLRSYATNEAGTGYGNELRFTIHISGATITDIDDNVYHAVTIGTQVWMAENMKASRFNDNSTLNYITSDYWQSSYPTYCWADNVYNSVYGALYNYDAVQLGYSPSKSVCPIGWHVPTDADWSTLIAYLGGENVAGGKLKETGTSHWLSNDPGDTNEYGFSALPGGNTNFKSVFNFVGLSGFWWTSSIEFINFEPYRNTYSILSNSGKIYKTKVDPHFGFSVRCLRDY